MTSNPSSPVHVFLLNTIYFIVHDTSLFDITQVPQTRHVQFYFCCNPEWSHQSPRLKSWISACFLRWYLVSCWVLVLGLPIKKIFLKSFPSCSHGHCLSSSCLDHCDNLLTNLPPLVLPLKNYHWIELQNENWLMTSTALNPSLLRCCFGMNPRLLSTGSCSCSLRPTGGAIPSKGHVLLHISCAPSAVSTCDLFLCPLPAWYSFSPFQTSSAVGFWKSVLGCVASVATACPWASLLGALTASICHRVVSMLVCLSLPLDCMFFEGKDGLHAFPSI